jgi:hypothetical protein
LQAVTSINNLICGKMYVDHKGTWTVTNCSTGMVAHMTFLPPSSMLSRIKRDRRHVSHMTFLTLRCPQKIALWETDETRPSWHIYALPCSGMLNRACKKQTPAILELNMSVAEKNLSVLGKSQMSHWS